MPIFTLSRRRNRKLRLSSCAAIAGLGMAVLILASAIAATRAAQSSPQDSSGIKLAEGEYSLIEEGSGGSFGPPNEEIYNFRETWTLFRADKSGYEVTGERQYESPQYTPRKEQFQVRLSRDFGLVSAKEYAKLRWRADTGPLGCEFQSKNLHCKFEAKDPKQALELDVPVKDPCGFLWPLSPFSFSSVVHAAEKSRSIPTRIQLISIEQPDAQNPVRPKVMDGEIHYLGREEITAAQQKWTADKFELHVATHPKLLMWMSREGILLLLHAADPSNSLPKEQLELIHYQKFQDF